MLPGLVLLVHGRDRIITLRFALIQLVLTAGRLSALKSLKPIAFAPNFPPFLSVFILSLRAFTLRSQRTTDATLSPGEQPKRLAKFTLVILIRVSKFSQRLSVQLELIA